MNAWHALAWTFLVVFVDWNVRLTKKQWHKMTSGDDDDCGNC